MRVFSHPRFLPLYSGAVTAALLVAVLAGFNDRATEDRRFGSIDVQRLRLVEPDGTVRLILAGNTRLPGVIVKGHEYAHEGRKKNGTAGMIFYDAEGSESGGLSFGGRRLEDGKVVRDGHLSFDQYGQDEMMTLVAVQNGDKRRAGLQFKDQPDYPIEDLLKLMEADRGKPEAQRMKRVEDYVAAHGAMHIPRVWLGRNDDRSSSLELKDDQGRPRLVAKVASDGTPTLEFLDANGDSVGRWPTAAGATGASPDRK